MPAPTTELSERVLSIDAILAADPQGADLLMQRDQAGLRMVLAEPGVLRAPATSSLIAIGRADAGTERFQGAIMIDPDAPDAEIAASVAGHLAAAMAQREQRRALAADNAVTAPDSKAIQAAGRAVRRAVAARLGIGLPAPLDGAVDTPDTTPMPRPTSPATGAGFRP